MEKAGNLRFRDGLLENYGDVLTPVALEALNALAPLNDDRRALMRARIERRAKRSRGRERIDFLPATATIGRTQITVSDARAGRFDGAEIPPDLQRQWIQGTGPGVAAAGADAGKHSQRGLRAALGRRRLDVRRRRCARPDRQHVARQSAEPEAGVCAGGRLHDGGRAGRGRDEHLGERVPRPSDRRRLAEATRFHDANFPRARAAPRRSSCPGLGRPRVFRLDRGHGALRREQSRRPGPGEPQRSSSICRRSRRPKRPPSGTT